MAKRLTYWILGGLVLGILAGWAIQTIRSATARPLRPSACTRSAATSRSSRTLFLRLIKMIIAPLVFSTLVAGIANMRDTAALGRVGAKALGLVHRRQPGVADIGPRPGQSAPSRHRARPAAAAGGGGGGGVAPHAFDPAEFISHIVPASMIDAMAQNEILQIVIFSIFVGGRDHRGRREGAAFGARGRGAGRGDAADHRLCHAPGADCGVRGGDQLDRPARGSA